MSEGTSSSSTTTSSTTSSTAPSQGVLSKAATGVKKLGQKVLFDSETANIRKAFLIPIILLALILSIIVFIRNSGDTLNNDEYETSGCFGLSVSIVVIFSGWMIVEGVRWISKRE